MDRKRKILMMALNDGDKATMRQLYIPKYETSKGLSQGDVKVLLTSEYEIIITALFTLLTTRK